MKDKPNTNLYNAINKNSNVARVKSIDGLDFYYKWLSFVRPFHNLTKAEMKVLASFLAKRHELYGIVKDEKIINNLIRSSQVRKEVREAIGMTVTQFNFLCGNLKKANVIVDNKINPRFIPNIESGSNEYRLILIFDINNESQVGIS